MTMARRAAIRDAVRGGVAVEVAEAVGTPVMEPGITIHIGPSCLILPLLSASASGVKGVMVPTLPFLGVQCSHDF
jgi:hypothetical protein